MKTIRMAVSDILMFLSVAMAYMIVIAGKIAGIEAFSKDAHSKGAIIPCLDCGMDMRIPAKYNADNIAKLEASEAAAVIRMNQAEEAMAKIIWHDDTGDEETLLREHNRKLEAVVEDAKNLLDAHDNGKPQYVPEGMDILRASVADLEAHEKIQEAM